MLKNDKTEKRIERHSITQEDFTPIQIVEQMLNNLPITAFTDFNKKVLDTSCGIGNFLVEVLTRRLANTNTIEKGIKAVSTIYGVELMADNVEQCREKLYSVFIKKFPQIQKDYKLNYKVRAIIKNRIQWYDSLTFDYDKWPKLRSMGKKDKAINFAEVQRLEDTKFPMWFKEKAEVIEPLLFTDDMFE